MLHIKTLFTTILLCALTILSNAQSNKNKSKISIIDNARYIATYNYEFQEDSVITSLRRQTTMMLYIGDHLSEFGNSNLFYRDSLYRNNNKEVQQITREYINHIMGSPTPMLAQYRIIKHKDSSSIDFYERILKTNYHIKENNKFIWELINSKDTIIAGYQCKLAQTNYRGRKYNAWYTLYVPISDGPYKFSGLPGLIIKLQDSHQEHVFELVSFSKKENNYPIYFSQQNFIILDINKYPQLKKNEILGRIKRVDSPQVENLTTDQMGHIEAKILSRNNIIEKY
nr:GLPGLI family protein [uncultured Carboxylicivirga sp.]